MPLVWKLLVPVVSTTAPGSKSAVKAVLPFVMDPVIWMTVSLDALRMV